MTTTTTQWISQRVWTETMDRLHAEALQIDADRDAEDAWNTAREAEYLASCSGDFDEGRMGGDA